MMSVSDSSAFLLKMLFVMCDLKAGNAEFQDIASKFEKQDSAPLPY